ncbi:uncharacterized protein [Drosophila bipectinata]|uniref:uncharacterized protein n=1 Tax=Drosophila bipectinata TaxID=42026 RepID=UPI0038B2AD6B
MSNRLNREDFAVVTNNGYSQKTTNIFPLCVATNVSMKTPDTKSKLLNNLSLSKHLSSKKGGSRTSNCGNCLEFSVLTRLSSVP